MNSIHILFNIITFNLNLINELINEFYLNTDLSLDEQTL